MHKNNKSKTNIIKTLMAMAIILIIVFTVADAMAERWTGNLLKNPNASEYIRHGTWDEPKHWPYQEGKRMRVYVWGPGNGTFWADLGAGQTSLTGQQIDVTQYADDIDTGTVKVHAGGEIRPDPRSSGEFQVFFYDESGSELRTKYYTERVSKEHKNVSITKTIPRKTRYIRMYMYAFQGIMFDDLFLKISLPEFSWINYYMDFGNLYYATNETARAYNKKQTQTFGFKNTGSGKLTCKITPAAGFTIVGQTTSDGLLSGETNTITVAFEGITSGNSNYNKPSAITITNHFGSGGVTAQARFYDIPTVTHVSPAKGSNGKVNIAVDDSVYFGVSSGNPLFPGAKIRGYQWQSTVAGAQPGSSWQGPFPDARKSFRWSSPGEYTLYCRMVDDNDVATAHVAIPVKVWNRPTVKAKPPKPENVHWYDNTYAGVVGEPIKLQADGELNGNEKIDRYIWLDDAEKELVKQTPGQIVNHTWDKQNLNGRIYCKAITNYGIESGKQQFNYKIYPTLEINPGGPYVGKPKKPITLKGSVSNANSYPGAVFQYEWILQKTKRDTLEFVPMGKTTDPTLEATWPKDGERIVRLKVTAITLEGLTLPGNAETTVRLEAGVPTARPGGPYRCGIAGGNFSPAQFEGNRPDFVEDEDVGNIVKWEWGFGGPTGNTLQFDGKDDYVEVTGDSLELKEDKTVEAWVYPHSFTWARIIFKRIDDNNDYQLTLYEGGGFAFAVNDGGTQYRALSTKYGNDSYGVNQWYHLAGTYDDATKQVKLYINGTRQGGTTSSGWGIGNLSPTSLQIGRRNDNAGYFEGKIDEVRVWNRALTEEEIVANAQGRTISMNEPGLVGYWSLDEGSGTTAKDNSSNGNHGTLKNDPKWVIVDNVFGPNATVWNPTHVYPTAGE